MRFIAKAEAGVGWRIWDNTAKQWWGEIYDQHPEALIAELNGKKRPEVLVTLARATEKRKKSKR
jgi:hypothetical protein